MRMLLSISIIITDGFKTMVQERKWRMIPAFVYFIALSALLAFVNAISPIAPFVYSLF